MQTVHACQYQKSKQTNQKMGGRPKHFSEEDVLMGKRHMNRCSASLNIREMQIKTTVRCHLTSVRMAIITKCTDNKCCIECGRNGALLHCWWGYKLIQPLWRAIWRFIKKKNKNKTTLWPNYLSTVHIARENHNSKGNMQPQCSLQQHLQ